MMACLARRKATLKRTAQRGGVLIPLPGPLESKSGMGFPAGREGLVVES